jgi:hypothetical protein
VSEATLAELGADPAARLAALDARVQAWLVDAEGRAVGAYKEDLDAFVEALRADATEPSTDLQALAALHFFATRYGDLADLISALISHCDAAADEEGLRGSAVQHAHVVPPSLPLFTFGDLCTRRLDPSGRASAYRHRRGDHGDSESRERERN